MLKLGELPKNAKELNEFLFSDFFKLNFNKSTIITSIYNLKKLEKKQDMYESRFDELKRYLGH